ncbi:MAG: hypothetical protein LBD84_06455 [Campylobacteraceae bacterium]|jgi:hypothetical protein|nr:hypothetical protein [Campylobacteraceae bacterium]
MRKSLIFTLFLTSLLFTGCVYKSTTSELARFDNILQENRCDFSIVDNKLKKGDDIILWSIQGGSLARNCGDFAKSTQFFDEAELHYKFDVDMKNTLLEIRDKTRSILINNNANPYEGNVYEKIMVNTYKALNFLSLNDNENARIEINRALERERIAKEYFANDIAYLEKKNAANLQELKSTQDLYNSFAKLKAEREEKKSGVKTKVQTFDFNENSIELAFEKYTQNSANAAYSNFINPFTTYLSALFLLNDRSYQRSVDLFKEGLQMDPKNLQLAKDFTLADKMAGEFNARFNEHYVWLIYENGFGVVRGETTINLPLFLASDSLLYSSIALPSLIFRPLSYPFLTIKNGSGDSFNTYVIADMDAIASAEFNKRYLGLAAQAIISAAAKTIIQKQLNDVDPILGFLGFAYQIATTKADTRSWSALPKRFEAASIPIKDGNIAIVDENGVILLQEFLQNDKNVIIYLKSPQKGQIIMNKIYF